MLRAEARAVEVATIEETKTKVRVVEPEMQAEEEPKAVITRQTGFARTITKTVNRLGTV